MFKKIKIFKSLKSRIFFSFSAISFLLIFLFAIYFTTFTLDYVIELDKVKVEKVANEFSLKLTNLLNNNLTLTKSLSLALENTYNVEESQRREICDNLLKNTLENSANVTAIWVRFKPYTIDKLDTLYHNPHNGISGQYIKTFYKKRKQVLERQVTSAEEEMLNTFITENPQNQPAFILPHLTNEYNDSHVKKDNIMRFIVPIYNQGKFVGIVGLDIELDNVSDLIIKEKNYEIYLLSNKFKFIIHPDKRIQDKNLTETYSLLSEEYQFLKNLREEEKFTKYGRIFNESQNYFYVFNSLNIPQINSTWNIVVSISEEKLYAEKRERAYLIIILAVFLYLGNLLFFWRLSLAVSKALETISVFLEKISLGEFDYKNNAMMFWTSNELKLISSRTEKLKKGLNKIGSFANNISKGNLHSKFKPLSEKDNLGESLIELKNSLLVSRNNEQIRQQEQEENNWTNIGTTKFGEILRVNLNSIDELSYLTISNLTDYVEAIQGGFFLYTQKEDKDFLELISFYSYNRKLYQHKIIELGEGLVGTCALEKKMINTKIPKNYLQISSGLGKSNPRYVILTPLVYNNQIMGVIEIASMKKFTQLQIDFITNISVNIASSLESVKVNKQTIELLEVSRRQSEQMMSKEAELKGKINELQNLQNESLIVEKHMRGFIDSLNKTAHTAEFDTTTKLISINNQLLNFLKIKYQEATIKNYYELFNIEVEDLNIHQNYWNKVLNGEIVKFLIKITLRKNFVWLDIILSPVFHNQEKISKILLIAFDQTKIQKQRLEIDKLIADTDKKAEQLSIQERDMEFTYQELENMYNQVEEKNNKISKINNEKEEETKRVLFFQKELGKRINRSQKIEKRLKERNKELLNEIRELKIRN